MIEPSPLCCTCQHTKRLHHNDFGFCIGRANALSGQACDCRGFTDEEPRKETRP